MDSLSATLAVRLQLEDIEELREAQKGKHVEGDIPDLEYAITIYGEELANQELLLSDRRMVYSISQAVQSDADVIGAIRVEENDNQRDRQLACTLGGVLNPTKPEREDFAYIDVDDELVQRLAALNTCKDVACVPKSRAESSTASSSKSRLDLPIRSGHRTVLCAACHEEKPFFDVIEVPCKHDYCRTCISELFEASSSDESLFPPRCCRQPIPVALANDFLTQEILLKFRAKSIEFSTPNRTYCARDFCSAFIPPSRIRGDVGTCPSCLHLTCSLCKQGSHDGDCPADTALQSLLDLAGTEGWRRCYGCRRMVELDTGCNHMTCPCSAQFCYACGERWKTCRCSQWHEPNLYARALQVVRRDAPAQPRAPEAEARQVRRVVENLRENHECGHTNWRYVRGPHHCEECGYNLPQYIFQCTNCMLQACNRCRRNRL